MVGGFFGEDFCKFREFLGKGNRRFCLFCSSSKFCDSGKSGHHWGFQDKVGVFLDDPMEGLVSLGSGDELVLSLMM